MRGRPQAMPGAGIFGISISYCTANKKPISERNFSHEASLKVREAALKHSY